jgi:hypothetical protein
MVSFQKFELVQEFCVHYVDTIVTVIELHDRTIVITHSHIVAYHEGLKLLDQTSLEVARATGLDSSIN